MLKAAAGIIDVAPPPVVDITTDPPPPVRARALWNVCARPGPAGYLEARPWTRDPITREFYEGETRILACSVEGLTKLLQRGVVPLGGDERGGVWYGAPELAWRQRKGQAA